MKCFTLIMLWSLCYSLKCHITCSTCLTESKDGCASCKEYNKLHVVSNINGIPIGECDEDMSGGKRRLLADSNSKGWAVAVIIVGVIAMVGYFGLLFYMIITWNAGSETKTEQPKEADQPKDDMEAKEPEPVVDDDDQNIEELEGVEDQISENNNS